MDGVKWMQVKMVPHDPMWKIEFRKMRDIIYSVWKEAVIDVQHVGSTAVPGIHAKPILDVAVVLKDLEAIDIEAMQREGFTYMGKRTESGDRQLFIQYVDDQIALSHIHCYGPDAEDYRFLIGFRDYLIAHPEAAKEYDQIKRNLAEVYGNDRFAYSDGKRAFIEAIIKKMM